MQYKSLFFNAIFFGRQQIHMNNKVCYNIARLSKTTTPSYARINGGPGTSFRLNNDAREKREKFPSVEIARLSSSLCCVVECCYYNQ